MTRTRLLAQKQAQAPLALGPAVTRWLSQVTRERPSLLTGHVGQLAQALKFSTAPLRLFSDAAESFPAAAASSAGAAATPEHAAAVSKSALKKAEKSAKKAESAGVGAGTVAAPTNAAPAAKPAAAAADAEADGIAVCDFRVGVITKAWVHPTADRLYCEEIDVGDASGPRQIASGLREHFSLEQMQGVRVVVVANLKPRPLAGFVSNGMVLCATGADGKVEFVAPPASARVGERVSFAEYEGAAPADPKRMDKKKIFDAVAPGLRVNDSCVATWNGIPFMTSGGPCTVPESAKGGAIK